MSKHCDEFHNGTINTDMFCLELDHILPMNGPGHVEKKMLECVTKVLWDIIGLSEFASWCDFSTVKSQQFLQSFGDHHIGFDFLFTVQETLAKELCHQFLTATSCTAPTTYHDLYNWLSSESITNPRAGIRCGNGELYFSAYEYVSLLTFVNNNTNHQLLSLFEQYTMSVAPDKVKEFILNNV